jgi:hypothetical protein
MTPTVETCSGFRYFSWPPKLSNYKKLPVEPGRTVDYRCRLSESNRRLQAFGTVVRYDHGEKVYVDLSVITASSDCPREQIWSEKPLPLTKIRSQIVHSTHAFNHLEVIIPAFVAKGERLSCAHRADIRQTGEAAIVGR